MYVYASYRIASDNKVDLYLNVLQFVLNFKCDFICTLFGLLK